MARGRNNSALNTPAFSVNPATQISVVSSGTVSKPKAYHVGKLHQSVPNVRVVEAPGASGTI